MPPPGTVPAVQTQQRGLDRCSAGSVGWAGVCGGLNRTHPSIASSTSCLIPLPSNTASWEVPASNTALNPKVASCLGALTWARGWWQLRGSRSPSWTPVGR